MTPEANPTTVNSPRRRRLALLLGASLLTVSIVVLLILLAAPKPGGSLAQMELADGRILQVEGMTYGTSHRIGQRSLIAERLGPWLPGKVRSHVEPKTPESTIELDQPALVVWVNAIDPETGAHVDCQGIRVEFVDKHGHLFGEATRSWFGGPDFWRVGHIFHCYPREEGQLTLRVTPWKQNMNIPVTTGLLNPRLSKPANWSGDPLPQSKSPGRIEIALTSLNLRTNEPKYWQTPSVYFEPEWELRRQGRPAEGWDEPEWIAEDPTGNRGQQLCPHWPSLRFSATVYPAATNTVDSDRIATLPQTSLPALTNRTWWNLRFQSATNEIVALGICPPGTQVFSEGIPDTNGPAMGPVRGGAPSGWTGQSRRVNPMKLKQWHGHYTPQATIYVRAGHLGDSGRLAVRLLDEQDRYWTAEPEPQGDRDGIRPFLVKVPKDVTIVTPELVLLRPVQAEFLVETGAGE
jgi:hypothetical protein